MTTKDTDKLFTVKRKLLQAMTKTISVDVRKNEPSFFKIPIKNIFEHKEIFSL